LLRQVAQRMKESIRASDTVGRIGGDEFVILMPMLADAEAARLLAEKLRHVIALPFQFEGRELRISCSMGVALYPEDGTDEITLAKSADEAMYQAKQDGRDMVRLAS
jgi:diguanylate cyclase (GGDEF)-like protein